MNQISRISVCKSLLRRNPFTRSSSKPMSSSLMSNNPSSSNLLITLSSKFHQTFLNPPPIFSTPGNHFRKYSCFLLDSPKCSGEAAAAAAAECNFDVDLLKEIGEIHKNIDEARDWIAVGDEYKNCFILWPHYEEAAVRARGAVKIASDEVNALEAKLGHDPGKANQRQLQRLGERMQYLNDDLDKLLDFCEPKGDGSYYTCNREI